MIAKDRMLELMAYADGELTGAEREKVERWLATDADAARFVNDVANLGELLKLGYEGRSEAKAIASFDIADAVLAAVEKEQGKGQEEEKAEPRQAAVVPIEAARARAGKDRRVLKIGAAVVAALALAASVFLVHRNTEQEAPIARAPAMPPPATAAVSAEIGGDVDVEIEETQGWSISVFHVPSETNLTTGVVVWVDESGGK
jgi:anti-sigma factor RsiW